MNMTRRNFVGSLVAMMAIPAIGKDNDWFEDIRVDRYYTLQGGTYGDTGGWGYPGYMLGPKLIENMDYWKYCREFEDTIEDVERRGFYLTPSSYFGEPYRRYDKIPLTKEWMMEFYNRHKGETWEMWKSGYDNHIAGLKSRGWRVVNGRFMNRDLGY